MTKEELKEEAKIMADNVWYCNTVSIQLAEDAEWVVYDSEDKKNTVVFTCDGNVYEYEYHTKEELESIIYDFFEELI